MNVKLNINGFETEAVFPGEFVQGECLPLLETLKNLYKGERVICLLAAPPGAGKSTLAAFLEELSKSIPDYPRLQAIGMDGFHFHQDYILSHTVTRNGIEVPMKSIKGAPDSFDVVKLANALVCLKHSPMRFPIYDRRLHDVVEDAISVDAPIVLIEGNWLLLNRPIWKNLPRDYAVFLNADKDKLKERLVGRKIRGGLTREQAEEFYLTSDSVNVETCLKESLPADKYLSL